MLYFKPETLTENIIKFTALEDDTECGFCLLKISDIAAEVYELNFQQDKPYLVEGLLRSAFNFASLRKIYIGKCTCDNITEFLDRMSFMKKDGEYVNDIPTILTGSCCK